MKKYYTYLLSMFFMHSFAIYGQAELVPNGGFELYAVCPIGFSEFEGKVDDWENPNTASPDFMDACANPFPAGVPVNGIGYQIPHAGSAYAGMYAFSGTLYREFIQVQLISPLTAGSSYLFQMYVVLHNKSNTAVDDIGVYFSSAAPFAAGTGMLSGSPLPQIVNPSASVITDTLNWTLISGTYTATGGEQYITIGHLKADASTTYMTLPSGTVGAYYYYDDISLKEVSVLSVSLQSFTAELLQEGINSSARLAWTTATEENNCCFYVCRSEDGINFTDIGRINGAGTSNAVLNYSYTDPHPATGINYYRLRQQDINGISAFSDIISLVNTDEARSISVIASDHSITILNNNEHELKASLYSLSSALAGEKYVQDKTTQWIIPADKKGIFILEIKDLSGNGDILSKKIFFD